jgi:mannose-1-phosphate guanylyltransferase
VKAMVLAAGLGTRMRPLTDLLAKPALPVLNRPLILWTLEQLARHGVSEVAVNLHHLPDTVRAAVEQEDALSLRVTYSFERTILGTGGALRRLRRFFGDDPFLLVNGDVLFDLDLTRLVACHRAAGALATLAVRANPDRRRYPPILTRDDGTIVSLPGVKRRRRGRAWLFAGIHVVEPTLLDRLPSGASDSVRDLYAPLVDEDRPLLAVALRGAWHDLGTPDLYRKAQVAMVGREGGRSGAGLIGVGARIAESARVRRSVIGPGAVVGAEADVSGSVLWAGAAIGAGASVRDSIVSTGGRVAMDARLRGAVVMPAGHGVGA